MAGPAILTDKYGPLPGYAWIGVAAGGVFIVAKVRGRKPASSSTPADTSGSSGSDTSAAQAAYQTGFNDGQSYAPGLSGGGGGGGGPLDWSGAQFPQPNTTTPGDGTTGTGDGSTSPPPTPTPAPSQTPVPVPVPSVPSGSVAVVPRPASTSPNYGIHTVVKGETIRGIAAEYGLTLSTLRAYNPQFNFGAPLMAGEQLRVRANARKL